MQQQLIQIGRDLQQTLVNGIPRVLLAVAVIGAMLVVARVFERVLRALLTRIRFDSLLEQSGSR